MPYSNENAEPSDRQLQLTKLKDDHQKALEGITGMLNTVTGQEFVQANGVQVYPITTLARNLQSIVKLTNMISERARRPH